MIRLNLDIEGVFNRLSHLDRDIQNEKKTKAKKSKSKKPPKESVDAYYNAKQESIIATQLENELKLKFGIEKTPSRDSLDNESQEIELEMEREKACFEQFDENLKHMQSPGEGEGDATKPVTEGATLHRKKEDQPSKHEDKPRKHEDQPKLRKGLELLDMSYTVRKGDNFEQFCRCLWENYSKLSKVHGEKIKKDRYFFNYAKSLFEERKKFALIDVIVSAVQQFSSKDSQGRENQTEQKNGFEASGYHPSLNSFSFSEETAENPVVFNAVKSLMEKYTRTLREIKMEIFLLEWSSELKVENIYETFDLYDKNKNGTIEFKEFVQGMHDLGLTASLSELRNTFDAIDTTKNGVLSLEEFEAAFTELEPPEEEYDEKKHTNVLRFI